MKYFRQVFLYLFIISIISSGHIFAQQGQMDWTQAVASSWWGGRSGHTSVVFDNKIWILGGDNNSWNGSNEVIYSTNGIDWDYATSSAQWSPRGGHASVVFNNKIWVIGGGYPYLNDVWYSSDGVNWTCATDSAPWRPREFFASVVFDNKIWVMGGYYGSAIGDVWYSSDGINWTCATTLAAWGRRRRLTAVVFDNKIWIMGGYSWESGSLCSDVWYSTDGMNWVCATPAAWWAAREGHTSVVFSNKMWVMGGNGRNDAWHSSDGVNWAPAISSSGWSIRHGLSSVAFDNRMWIMGGRTGMSSSANDVWYSRGMQITVISPNSSEIWLGGSIHQIKWRMLRTSGFSHYRILLSHNGITYPDTIIHNIAPTESTYEWIVSPINTTTCHVKVQVIDTSGIVIVQDATDWDFTIKSISMEAPNGSEMLIGGADYTIVWWRSHFIECSGYRLLLSKNSGVNYNDTIAYSMLSSDTTYQWQIPIINCHSCLVKVELLDRAGSVICQDEGNCDFWIESAVIVIPNGGENYIGGSQQTMTWQSLTDFNYANYRVLLSRDAGYSSIDTVIPYGAPYDTSHSWIVPALNLTTCRLRLEIIDSLNHVMLADISNSNFIITTMANIVTPDGGEVWPSGSSQTIKWRTTGTGFSHYRILFSENNGYDFPDTLAHNVPVNESTFLWVTPLINSSSCRIKIQILDNFTNIISEDISNGNFSIRTQPNVNSPNGGENWLAGTRQTIRWTTIGTGFSRYRILLSQNSGTNYSDTIAHNVSATELSYIWTVPYLNVMTCRIKIQILDSLSNVISEDASNGDFSIQSVIVVSPNGSEIWPGGSNQIIKWRMMTVSSFVCLRILLSKNSGATYLDSIVQNITTSESTYTWLVPAINNSSCRVKTQVIDSFSNVLYEDASNGNFTIRTLPTVVVPNGGENWLGGTNQIIKWRSTGTGFSRYRILLSRNGGSSYLDTVANNILPAESTFLWLTPLINSTSCRIKIQIVDSLNAIISDDVSNSNFSIQTAIVVSPNGGEVWSGGSTQIIKWRSSSIEISQFRLLLSRNSGSTYTDTINHCIAQTESTFLWVTPTINITTCRIKVQALDTLANILSEDASNNNFTIHTITLTAPNGGEYVQGGSVRTIRWRTTIGQSFSNYRLLLSVNSDTTYPDTIAHNVSAVDTLYNWTVPVINRNTCRVKIQIIGGIDNIICQDASNSNFTIDSDPPNSFSLIFPSNNSWTNVTPRFIWHRTTDNFQMSNYQLSIAVPNETITVTAQDSINPIPSAGSSWTQATANAQWSSRLYHSSVVFNNTIWVIGGYDGNNRNDVWYSSDGANWICATQSAQWSPRYGHTSVVFDNKMWVIGGNDGNNRNDVWYSTDGINWVCATQSAQWSGRFAHTSVVFNNKIWVLGGSVRNDVWYSTDGINWACATSSAQWSPRDVHSSVVFNNKMWVLGGGNNNRDVWYSCDGINWTCATTTAWYTGGKNGHTSVIFDNKMWVIGGGSSGGDVWYSDNGTEWFNAAYHAEWSERRNHTSVVFRGAMWVLGGIDRIYNTYINDVWYSVSPPYLPEGNQIWWVTAYDRAGNSRRSNETFIIRVDTTPPSMAVLISPINGVILTNPMVNFFWHSSVDVLSGFQYYKIQVANNHDFVNANTIPITDTCVNLTCSDTTYYWRVKAIDNVGNETDWTAIANFIVRASGYIEEQTPCAIYHPIFKIYPNPVISQTVICYSLSVPSKVMIQLHDISGRLVEIIADEQKQPGNYSLSFNSKVLSAGVYFVTLSTDEKRLIERLVVVR